jgi:lysyl-tRNA synthetase class 2
LKIQLNIEQEGIMEDQNAPLEQIISIRKQKLDKLKELGINPYPTFFESTGRLAELAEKFNSLAVGQTLEEKVSVSGRIISRREMGKASFCDIVDMTGKIQLYFKADIVGADSFKIFKDLIDLSDFIGVSGTPFRTRTGELSILVKEWTLLTKTLRPLPEKWHGLKDTETRYRQRYLDLVANAEVKDIFLKRSKIVSAIRSDLEKRGFLEVETPMMQRIAGGAAARPFITHHNTLDMDLFLRIAPELYLKRLVTGGMERVFEIGRNFRNEGIDRNHNPEFTMLELYQAYVGYETMMTLCEELIVTGAKAVGKEIAYPFVRAKLFDLIKQHANIDAEPLIGTGEMKKLVKQFHLDIPENTPEKKILDHLFDEKVLPNLDKPTFVIDYPSLYSPLAKSKKDNPAIAERFELYMNKMEIANAYSELNDPEEQRRRFEGQMDAKKKGDDETEPYDEDFVVALEHGMPPTGGLGIGIDRLVMILADVDSVREVILFPTLRPEQ